MDHAKTVHVLIKGRVQGVWYRGWTVQQASARGLMGWVRNLTDGRVEAVFSGPPAAVDAMIESCRRGPPGARVTGLDMGPSTELGFHGFHQRPTA